MTAPILVTGGTGALGRRVVPRLTQAGYDVRVLARHGQPGGDGVQYVTGDLATGEGVEPAVEGAETILHLAGSQKGDGDKARTLVRAASRAGNPHLVYISVVGADRVPVTSAADRAMFGYFAAKLEAERAVASSGLPWTTMRATQFHDLVLKLVRPLSKLPVVPVPPGRYQPIETDEVAARLVELALGEPAGLVPDMAGPRVSSMADLVRAYLRITHKRRPVVTLWQPGAAARAIAKGANLSLDRAVGKRTWEEFLAEHAG